MLTHKDWYKIIKSKWLIFYSIVLNLLKQMIKFRLNPYIDNLKDMIEYKSIKLINEFTARNLIW